MTNVMIDYILTRRLRRKDFKINFANIVRHKMTNDNMFIIKYAIFQVARTKISSRLNESNKNFRNENKSEERNYERRE